jgi:F0F1-type ATP synthase membrane subunit c/vacuolar-type H+-ATPase subunit K
MDTLATSNMKNRPFLWGLVINLAFSVPTLISMALSFRGISEQKATGLGAVAAGMSETYAIYGMAFTIIAPIVAIFLLVRSLSDGHRFRNFISWLLTGWSFLMLIYFAVGACLFTLWLWRR